MVDVTDLKRCKFWRLPRPVPKTRFAGNPDGVHVARPAWLPGDAELVGVWCLCDGGCCLKFRHPSFPSVPEGEPCPELE